MSQTIPNLWPDDIKIDVQSPITILRVQAELLGRVTRGILQGEVESEETEKKVQHRLVVVAPAYHGQRHTLLTLRHDRELPYPVEVIAAAFIGLRSSPYPFAASDDELQDYIKKALQSPQTKGVITSLISKSNETTRISYREETREPDTFSEDSSDE